MLGTSDSVALLLLMSIPLGVLSISFFFLCNFSNTEMEESVANLAFARCFNVCDLL